MGEPRLCSAQIYVQERVLSVLRETLTGFEPRYRTCVFRPRDWAAIEETLR